MTGWREFRKEIEVAAENFGRGATVIGFVLRTAMMWWLGVLNPAFWSFFRRPEK
jgi:hypothetical protein